MLYLSKIQNSSRRGSKMHIPKTGDKEMHDIPIYDRGHVPDLRGFEKMDGYAIDAYPCQHGTDLYGPGDFSQDAQELALRTAASRFRISEACVLDQYEICIVPGVGFHGKIMSRRK